jgi:hypothetical protein
MLRGAVDAAIKLDTSRAHLWRLFDQLQNGGDNATAILHFFFDGDVAIDFKASKEARLAALRSELDVVVAEAVAMKTAEFEEDIKTATENLHDVDVEIDAFRDVMTQTVAAGTVEATPVTAVALMRQRNRLRGLSSVRQQLVKLLRKAETALDAASAASVRAATDEIEERMRVVGEEDATEVVRNAVDALIDLIDDIEVKCKLQLRLCMRFPFVYTKCCNRRQCFRCKSYGIHEGKTCEEVQAAEYDNEVRQCPACSISLVKGDGCSYITCVCGESFNWS